MARPRRQPFFPRLAEYRTRARLTQEQVAERLGVSVEMVRKHERALALPREEIRLRYVELYGADQVALGLLTRPPAAPLGVLSGSPEWDPSGEAPDDDMRIDGTYVDTVRSRTRQLLELDAHFGGDQSAGVAYRLFRSVRRKLGATSIAPGVHRDLLSATAELGEVAGWFLYDSQQHDLARRTNQEAQRLARLAGDSSMELLILQNMSLHAGDLGQPDEALGIAKMVLETADLSPRLHALFRIRESRALAKAGADGGARRTFRHAQSLYLDGTRDSDPGWAWWINDHELTGHDATIQADLGEWGRAAETFQHSIELIPNRLVRQRYFHMSALLNAQIHARSWSDAETTMASVTPYVDEIGSSRSASTLLRALVQLGTTTAPASVRDSSCHLRAALAAAGYER